MCEKGRKGFKFRSLKSRSVGEKKGTADPQSACGETVKKINMKQARMGEC